MKSAGHECIAASRRRSWLRSPGWRRPRRPDSAGTKGFADFEVSLSGPAGPIPKGQTADYTAVVTNVGDGAASPEDSVGLYSYRAGGERPVQNPFRSVSQTSGRGVLDRAHAVELRGLPLSDLLGRWSRPRAVDHDRRDDRDQRVDGSQLDRKRRRHDFVDAPPEVSGSKQIKVGGLPRACAASDFKLIARAKRAKKVTAALHGPLTVEGKPENTGEGFTKKLATANGPKLTARVGAGDLPPGYYGIKLAAKYEDGPKQKASVLFQAC